MAQLPEYNELAEKAKYFRNGDMRIAYNIDGIFTKLEEFYATGDFIFRCCSEAKYKLYNSAQRYYITNEIYKQVSSNDIPAHYDNFISDLIVECKGWNNETVKKLLIKNKIHEENSLAYLSYMQHFGALSPLLDFTFDPYIALFFAVDNISYTPSDNEIDNYFSIYYTYQNATIFEAWKSTFNITAPNLSQGNIPYSDVNQNVMHILLPDNEGYQILNNTNIINQRGLFFYNNSPLQPLEEKYFEFADLVKQNLGQKMFDHLLMHEQFANCFNIHKSLVPYIKDVLAAKGITKEYIYPDVYKMKTAILHNATVKALRTKK